MLRMVRRAMSMKLSGFVPGAGFPRRTSAEEDSSSSARSMAPAWWLHARRPVENGSCDALRIHSLKGVVYVQKTCH